MNVTHKPHIGKRKRSSDGKIIDVPAVSPCGAKQVILMIDDRPVGYTLDKPGAAINLTIHDLIDEEKDAVKSYVAATFGGNGRTSEPPAPRNKKESAK